MRALTLFAALAFPAASIAAPYPYTISGDRFIDMMHRPEPLNSYDYMLREKAYSYLDGTRDSAEGSIWCDVNELKTPDLAYEVAAKIAKLPAPERKKNASLLILQQLKLMYPCRKTGGRS
jgi:hypothetical protein